MRRSAVIAITALGLAGLGVGLWLGLGRTPTVTDPPLLPNRDRVDAEVAALVDQVVQRVRRAPRDAEAWAALAMVYQANGLGSLAETCYTQALALDDSNAHWWYQRSRSRARQEDLAGALHDLGRAIDRDDAYAPLYWNRGYLHLDAARTDDATADFRRALAVDPSDPAAAVGLARVELVNGDARAAAARLEQLLTAHGQSSFAPYLHGLLASAYRQLGDLGRAGRHAGIATGQVPAWPDPWSADLEPFRRGYQVTLKRAETYAAAGRVPEAIEMLRGLLSRHPDDLPAINLLNGIYQQTGRTDEAIVLLERVVAKDPEHAVSHLNLSHLYQQKGNRAMAMRHAEAALDANQAFGAAHLQRGRLLLLGNELEPAAAALESAFRYGVDDAGARLMYGQVLLELIRFDAARVQFEAVLTRSPDNVSAWTGLAVALVEIGETDRARQALARARQLGPATDYDRQKLNVVQARLDGRVGPSP